MASFQDITHILAKLDNPKDVDNFFYDLTSQTEREEFARRFEAAKMLDDGISYKNIEEQTGMSSTTIASIAKFLNGKKGGYKKALNLLKKDQ